MSSLVGKCNSEAARAVLGRFTSRDTLTCNISSSATSATNSYSSFGSNVDHIPNDDGYGNILDIGEEEWYTSTTMTTMSGHTTEEDLGKGYDSDAVVSVYAVPENKVNVSFEYTSPDAPLLCRSFSNIMNIESNVSNVASIELSMQGFRVIHQTSRKFAQFLIKLKINRERVVYVWRRHSEFEDLVEDIRAGKLGDSDFSGSIAAWNDVLHQKSWFRNLNYNYLREKQAGLEVFMEQLLNEISSLDTLMYFLEEGPSTRRSFTVPSKVDNDDCGNELSAACAFQELLDFLPNLFDNLCPVVDDDL